MNIKEACKKRSIRAIGIDTPLLVPSFSSIAWPKIGEIHGWIKDYISAASLVSSYDLHHKFIDPSKIWVSDVVFIDSGTFEHENDPDLNKEKNWGTYLHKEVIDSLKPLTKTVLISYDTKADLAQQIRNAAELRSSHPNHAICFLCKPTSDSEYFRTGDIHTLVQNSDALKSFDVLGFTDKELGNSLLEKCKKVLDTRKRLVSKGLDMPIHIFGCLDPLGILPYFLCGADIFDGLSWLKYGFYNNVAIYSNNYSLLKRSWSESDSEAREKTFIFNLEELGYLTRSMKQFTQQYDLSVFELPDEILDKVKGLTSLAGIEY